MPYSDSRMWQNQMGNMIGQAGQAYNPNMLQNFLGLNTPDAPDFSGIIQNLSQFSDQIGTLFGPDQRAEVIGGQRQQGTDAINTMMRNANQATRSQAGYTGMYDSAPVGAQVAQNYGQGANAFAQLEGDLTQTGLGFDQMMMQAILSQAGLQGQIGQFQNLDFQNQLGRQDVAGQGFTNILDLLGQGSSIGALGGFNG